MNEAYRLKLFYSPGACSLAPHIVARETGHAFDLVKVDIPSKKTADGEDYWQINPKGYVPALMLSDGQVITEVSVICQYLSDTRPEHGLTPRLGTIEYYHQSSALNFVATEIHKQIGALFNPKMTPEMKQVQIGSVERRFNTLEKMLEGKPHITGERFTAADVYLFTVLNWAPIHNIDLSKWPNIHAFVARVAERPMVQEAMRAEGLLKSEEPAAT